MNGTDRPIPGRRESKALRDLYSWPFSVSGINDIAAYREGASDGSDRAQLVRAGLESLLERRPLSIADWLHLTGYQFHSEDELYGYLRQVYEFFYLGAAHPRPPDPGRWAPAEFWGPPLPSAEPPEELPLADEPELQFAPWYARYESDLASTKASVALVTTAVRTRDLAPILPFAEVYGPGEASLGQASATSNYPDERPAPDSPITHAHLELDQEALAMAVFHPGRGVRAGGPAHESELENSLFWASPALPGLRAVELPGVDRRFVNFCAGWLGVDAADAFWELGRSFGAAWPDYREAVEAGLLHLIRERPLTVEQWHGLTHVRFAGVDELTCHLRQVHRLLYGMPSSKIT